MKLNRIASVVRRIHQVMFCLMLIALTTSCFARPAMADTAPVSFHEICRLGRGRPQNGALRADGKVIAVDTPLGTWLYTDQFEDIAYLDEIHLPAFSPEGTLLAGVIKQTQIGIWNGTSFDSLSAVGKHQKAIKHLEWSADGHYLVSLDEGGLLMMWDVKMRQPYLQIQDAPDSQVRLLWGVEGNRAAVLRSDTSVGVYDLLPDSLPVEIAADSRYAQKYAPRVYWNPNGKQLVREFRDKNEHSIVQAFHPQSGDMTFELTFSDVEGLSFNPSGSQIAITSEKTHLYDAALGKRIFTLPAGEYSSRGVQWSHNGAWLVTKMSAPPRSSIHESVFLIWDPITGKLLNKFQGQMGDGALVSLLWSADDTHILSLTRSGEVYYWDVASETGITFVKHTFVNQETTWSPRGDQVAVADTIGGAQIWNAQKCERISTLRGHLGEIEGIAWHPRRADLLATYANGGDLDGNIDKTVRIWDPQTGQPLTILPGQERSVAALAWSHEGSTLASGGFDGNLFVWSVYDWRRMPQKINRSDPFWFIILDLQPTPHDYQFLVIGSGTHGINPRLLVDTSTGKTVRWIHQYNKGYAYAWSLEGTTLRSASWLMFRHVYVEPPRVEISEDDFTVRIDTLFGVDEPPSIILRGHRDFITDSDWNPDQTLLATTSQDGTVRVWNTATGETIHVFSTASFAAWSLVGNVLAVESEGKLQVWYPDSDQTKPLLDGGMRAVWSPDGTLLVVVSESQPPQIFDAANGDIVGTLHPSSDSVSWSPDGSTLIQQFEGTLIIWGR